MSTALAQHIREVAEVVIVTGSYIRCAPEDAALPVDVISSEELEKIGSPTTLELIKGLTVSNGVLDDTNQFDSRAQGNEGSVNLRGLGRLGLEKREQQRPARRRIPAQIRAAGPGARLGVS